MYVCLLGRLQYDLDEYLDLLRQKQSLLVDVADQITVAEQKAAELKLEIRRLNAMYNAKFNSNWGQLFKAGHQDSRFAKQVADYACLYTSRASNLAFVSPNRPFRPRQDFMQHDRVADGASSQSF
jgi:5'-nucleotidase